MKKFFVILIVLFIIIAIGLFVFILTFDVNKYRPVLIEKLEEAIDKDVRISNISLSILPSLAFRIDGVSIKDTDNAWEEYLLKVASIEAKIKILPLLKKDIEIDHLHIKGLDIVITKDVMLPLPKSNNPSKNDIDIGQATAGALKFLAKSVSIVDSTINYVDSPMDIKIDIIEAALKNISLYGPMHIDARLSVFGRGLENIAFSSILYPEFENKTPYIKNLDLRISLGKFSFESVFDALGKGDFPREMAGKELKGELAITSEKIFFKLRKIYDSSIYVDLSGGESDILPVKGGLKDIDLKAEITRGNISIKRLKGLVAGGSFDVNGAIKDILSRQQADLDIKLEDIDVSMLLPDAAPNEPRLEGRLNIDIQSSTRGLTAQKILDKLTAEGSVKLDGTILKNMNILRAALQKLDMLPGLLESLTSRLPEDYKGLLGQKDTFFKPIETKFNMKERKLFFQKTVVASDAFYLVGSGYLGTNRDIDIRANLFIPPDFSDAFIGVVRQLEYLQDSQGMITMPISIDGRIPDISIRPDLDYVIQKLVVSKGQELLESIFKKEGPEEPGEEGVEGQKKKREDIDPKEAIIKTIFDIITSPRE